MQEPQTPPASNSWGFNPEDHSQRPQNWQQNRPQQNGGWQGQSSNQQGGQSNQNYGRPAQGDQERRNWSNNNGNNQRNNNFRGRPEDLSDISIFRPYAVVGNRETPHEATAAISRCVQELGELGYTLRTGGMEGLEDVVEKATNARKEVHLPWKGFASKESKFTWTTEKSKRLAAMFQPGWEGLKPALQMFLAKNVRVLLGKDSNSPALFLITWSPDGCESAITRSGTTGQSVAHAIAIASVLKIPIFNFFNQDADQRLREYLARHEKKVLPDHVS